jgi:hypothetical protein
MRTLQVISEQNLCVHCYEPITNPVCESCHLREVDEWLGSMLLSKAARTVILSEIKKNLPEEAMNENQCILCGKNTLSTCSYCFFLVSARVLKKLRVNPAIIEEFLYSFDYRKGHNEYFE